MGKNEKPHHQVTLQRSLSASHINLLYSSSGNNPSLISHRTMSNSQIAPVPDSIQYCLYKSKAKASLLHSITAAHHVNVMDMQTILSTMANTSKSTDILFTQQYKTALAILYSNRLHTIPSHLSQHHLGTSHTGGDDEKHLYYVLPPSNVDAVMEILSPLTTQQDRLLGQSAANTTGGCAYLTAERVKSLQTIASEVANVSALQSPASLVSLNHFINTSTKLDRAAGGADAADGKDLHNEIRSAPPLVRDSTIPPDEIKSIRICAEDLTLDEIHATITSSFCPSLVIITLVRLAKMIMGDISKHGSSSLLYNRQNMTIFENKLHLQTCLQLCNLQSIQNIPLNLQHLDVKTFPSIGFETTSHILDPTTSPHVGSTSTDIKFPPILHTLSSQPTDVETLKQYMIKHYRSLKLKPLVDRFDQLSNIDIEHLWQPILSEAMHVRSTTVLKQLPSPLPLTYDYTAEKAQMFDIFHATSDQYIDGYVTLARQSFYRYANTVPLQCPKVSLSEFVGWQHQVWREYLSVYSTLQSAVVRGNTLFDVFLQHYINNPDKSGYEHLIQYYTTPEDHNYVYYYLDTQLYRQYIQQYNITWNEELSILNDHHASNTTTSALDHTLLYPQGMSIATINHITGTFYSPRIFLTGITALRSMINSNHHKYLSLLDILLITSASCTAGIIHYLSKTPPASDSRVSPQTLTHLNTTGKSITPTPSTAPTPPPSPSSRQGNNPIISYRKLFAATAEYILSHGYTNLSRIHNMISTTFFPLRDILTGDILPTLFVIHARAPYLLVDILDDGPNSYIHAVNTILGLKLQSRDEFRMFFTKSYQSFEQFKDHYKVKYDDFTELNSPGIDEFMKKRQEYEELYGDYHNLNGVPPPPPQGSAAPQAYTAALEAEQQQNESDKIQSQDAQDLNLSNVSISSTQFDFKKQEKLRRGMRQTKNAVMRDYTTMTRGLYKTLTEEHRITIEDLDNPEHPSMEVFPYKFSLVDSTIRMCQDFGQLRTVFLQFGKTTFANPTTELPHTQVKKPLQAIESVQPTSPQLPLVKRLQTIQPSLMAAGLTLHTGDEDDNIEGISSNSNAYGGPSRGTIGDHHDDIDDDDIDFLFGQSGDLIPGDEEHSLNQTIIMNTTLTSGGDDDQLVPTPSKQQSLVINLDQLPSLADDDDGDIDDTDAFLSPSELNLSNISFRNPENDEDEMKSYGNFVLFDKVRDGKTVPDTVHAANITTIPNTAAVAAHGSPQSSQLHDHPLAIYTPTQLSQQSPAVQFYYKKRRLYLDILAENSDIMNDCQLDGLEIIGMDLSIYDDDKNQFVFDLDQRFTHTHPHLYPATSAQ